MFSTKFIYFDQMRPWKRFSKSSQNVEHTPYTPQSQYVSNEGGSSSRPQTGSRTSNWTELMDKTLLSLLTEEHALGNNINGMFTTLAWNRVYAEVNSVNNTDLTKDQIKNRLKVLKRNFVLYNYLANKSGWRWVYVNNIPTPGDNEDWEAVIAENPTYAKCRDKPFPHYKDLEFLTQKTTATGRYGFSSAMEASQNVDSSSSSPPDEYEDTVPPLDENIRPDNTSRSPSPANVRPNVGGSGSGSGHSSAGKRPRSARRPASQRRHGPSSSGGRRQQEENPYNTFVEMVDIGRQKLDLVRQLYQVEITRRDSIASIEDCMTRVYSLYGITPERILAASEALKDDKNRQMFMTMTGDLAIMWLDRQVAKEQLTFRQFFPGV